ncbi:MAG: SRPBCC family protein [Pseudomonadota bacterium]
MCAARVQEQRWASKYPWLGTGPVSSEPCISPSVFEQEVEKVFKRVWLCMGRVEEFPEPGCYKLKQLDFASAGVLLIRGKDGVIRAFHNVCSHRGNTVVVPEGEWDNFGKKGMFSCRFHAWSYNDKGELVGVQNQDCFHAEFCKEDNGLTPIRCEVWEGFVFINFAEDPDVGLQEYLGDMGQHFTGYPYHELTYQHTYYTYLNCNWKIGVDAFAEAYHVNTIHAGSFPGTFSTGLQMVKLLGDHRTTAICFNPPRDGPPMATLSQTRARGSLVNNVNGTTLPPTINDESRDDFSFELSVFFPNWLLHVAEGIWFTHQFWPISHDKCLWEGKYYTRAPTTHSERWAMEAAVCLQRNAWLEDTATMEGTFYALRSGAKKQLHLQDEEILVRHGYHVLDKYLDSEA